MQGGYADRRWSRTVAKYDGDAKGGRKSETAKEGSVQVGKRPRLRSSDWCRRTDRCRGERSTCLSSMPVLLYHCLSDFLLSWSMVRLHCGSCARTLVLLKICLWFLQGVFDASSAHIAKDKITELVVELVFHTYLACAEVDEER